MNRRCLNGLVTLAMIIAMVGHWGLIQSVAWVGMAVRYAQSESLGAALQQTFDGKHPCRLCLVVREGKSREKDQSVTLLRTHLELLASESPRFQHPAIPSSRAPEPLAPAGSFSDPPPLPPPRLA